MEKKGEQQDKINYQDQENKNQEELIEKAEDEQSPSEADESSEIIEKLQNEIAEKNEDFLRAKAETENVRRRAIEEKIKAHKFAIENFVIDLLPVVDALRASINNQDASAEKIIEGVELTEKMLTNALEKNSVKEIAALNQKFDPNIHEAMTMEESDTEPGSIIRVFQSGYQLNERTIRPALVVVAKKKE